jgi:hypothetical protein
MIGQDFVTFKKEETDEEVDVVKTKAIWSGIMDRALKGVKAVGFLDTIGLGDGIYRLTGWASLQANMSFERIAELGVDLKGHQKYDEYVKLTAN